MPPKHHTKSGAGFFDDLADGIKAGINLLGGKIASIEEHLDLEPMNEEETNHYVNSFQGSGMSQQIWETVKKTAKSPVTHAVVHAALPIAIKLLAGRVMRIHDHLGIEDEDDGGSYAVGGDYRTAGGIYADSQKMFSSQKGAGYETGGEYQVGGRVTKKTTIRKKKGSGYETGGNTILGTTTNSRPPVQRAMTLKDLVD